MTNQKLAVTSKLRVHTSNGLAQVYSVQVQVWTKLPLTLKDPCGPKYPHGSVKIHCSVRTSFLKEVLQGPSWKALSVELVREMQVATLVECRLRAQVSNPCTHTVKPMHKSDTESLAETKKKSPTTCADLYPVTIAHSRQFAEVLWWYMREYISRILHIRLEPSVVILFFFSL